MRKFVSENLELYTRFFFIIMITCGGRGLARLYANVLVGEKQEKGNFPPFASTNY